MKTFYLSGSSAHYSALKKKVADLYGMGLTWHANCNWIPVVEETFGMPNTAHHFARQGAVFRDFYGATHADLFVAVLSPVDVSRGTYMEIGARLASGKEVKVVLQGGATHLFFEHPGIEVFETWSEFVADLYVRLQS